MKRVTYLLGDTDLLGKFGVISHRCHKVVLLFTYARHLNQRNGHLRHYGEWPLDGGLVLVLNVEHSGVRGDLHVKLFDEFKLMNYRRMNQIDELQEHE